MSNLKIFTDNIEQEALVQVETLVNHPAFSDCKVRIMPDVHAGKGCVVGFTANLGEKVIPNIVGADIGCGMGVVELGKIDIDYQKLDRVINKYIPAGKNVHSTPQKYFDLILLSCYEKLKNIEWLKGSMGTLGGGNHFIEIDEDTKGKKYLVVHTGSRNLGAQVAKIYQELAVDAMKGADVFPLVRDALIKNLKAEHRETEISGALKDLKNAFAKVVVEDIPKELCYLTGQNALNYLHDMKLCQTFAAENRKNIVDRICYEMGWYINYYFETIHNYIDDNNIVRKGAISAKYNEKVIIPMNMRDGCIIGIGKGNEDWNCSAPHGAGRMMSRGKAKANISIEEYEASMKGIYTTSVNYSTVDEAPMAYKPVEEILEYIQDTVDVIEVIKPVYNFKASE